MPTSAGARPPLPSKPRRRKPPRKTLSSGNVFAADRLVAADESALEPKLYGKDLPVPGPPPRRTAGSSSFYSMPTVERLEKVFNRAPRAAPRGGENRAAPRAHISVEDECAGTPPPSSSQCSIGMVSPGAAVAPSARDGTGPDHVVDGQGPWKVGEAWTKRASCLELQDQFL